MVTEDRSLNIYFNGEDIRSFIHFNINHVYSILNFYCKNKIHLQMVTNVKLVRKCETDIKENTDFPFI